MKSIFNLLLSFILGVIVGIEMKGKLIGKSIRQAMEPLAPLVMRKHFNLRKQIAMQYFMDFTGYACIRCPKCDGIIGLKSICKVCNHRGYIVVPKTHITEYDIPYWKGFKKEIENRRFKNLVEKKEFDAIMKDRDLK